MCSEFRRCMRNFKLDVQGVDGRSIIGLPWGTYVKVSGELKDYLRSLDNE